MPGQPIIPKGAAPPLAPYSPGTRAGDIVYTAGTVPIDADGNVVGVGDICTQTRHVLETIKAIVEEAGGTLSDVVFNQIFLKDYSDYSNMNEVYKEYFSTNPPARYCIRADLVKPEFLVEIASIAHL
tara:strand:- start:1017 stop:1397 length:381 start_codon:yes stop_codon:yes gene_type:complete